MVLDADEAFSNFKIESVEIAKEGTVIRYKNDVIGKDILTEAQKQFDEYLKNILLTKQNEGITNIKR